MDFKAKKMIEEDVSPLRYKIFIWMAAQRIAWQSEVYSTQPNAFRATNGRDDRSHPDGLHLLPTNLVCRPTQVWSANASAIPG